MIINYNVLFLSNYYKIVFHIYIYKFYELKFYFEYIIAYFNNTKIINIKLKYFLSKYNAFISLLIKL